ncbi:hypothetical protein Athai_09840 [Actinocatenispora thailandica]|uniref:NIF system FeS cluster assembly NifU C-terminal domain-containing protein n=2 Tax=Actinocatenispora thailandica TaxID=227318 RepID=A0A7R7DL44_9ACTN|nr:hypothetical protein Athai_09840 [Actinocatenispora thailandica]
MHPEATGDPQTVRWVIPAGTLPVAGPMAALPDELDGLAAAGVVDCVEVESRAVLVRLADGHRWDADGPAVRAGLSAALQQPERWRPVHRGSDEELLRGALQDVLDGPAGDYVRSHGGQITITSTRDCRAEVSMTGTCAHCPAVDLTLHSRLESELRQRFPRLVELRAVDGSGSTRHGGRPTWLTLRRRRG